MFIGWAFQATYAVVVPGSWAVSGGLPLPGASSAIGLASAEPANTSMAPSVAVAATSVRPPRRQAETRFFVA